MTNVVNGGNGSALMIDPEKLGQQGWMLIGGIEALNAAEMAIRDIRQKSTVVQERVFLAETADLLRAFAEEHQKQLAALAMLKGAVEMHEAPSAKPN